MVVSALEPTEEEEEEEEALAVAHEQKKKSVETWVIAVKAVAKVNITFATTKKSGFAFLDGKLLFLHQLITTYSLYNNKSFENDTDIG